MKRHRGRPRIDDTDESVQVTVTLPARDYDRMARQAIREQISLPAVIRRSCTPTLGQPDSGTRVDPAPRVDVPN